MGLYFQDANLSISVQYMADRAALNGRLLPRFGQVRAIPADGRARLGEGMATELDAKATATLLEEVDPVIRGAIRRKLRVTLRASDSREQNMDGLDLLGEVQLKLLAKLRQGGEVEIKEFKAYAATVAYHCCADYLRAKYPQRTSLKNCLR